MVLRTLLDLVIIGINVAMIVIGLKKFVSGSTSRLDESDDSVKISTIWGVAADAEVWVDAYVPVAFAPTGQYRLIRALAENQMSNESWSATMIIDTSMLLANEEVAATLASAAEGTGANTQMFTRALAATSVDAA